MKKLFAIFVMLCCLSAPCLAETSYFEENGLTVHELSSEYIPVKRAMVMYYSEAVYDCGMKCTVVSDTVEDGERLLHVRLTLFADDYDASDVRSSCYYVYPTIYDYYTGTRCTLRDTAPATSRMELMLDGEEISVIGKVIDSTFVYYDTYFVYTVDYTFEMPIGYDGIVIACFPAFEFEDFNDFRNRMDLQNYVRPIDGTEGVFIRVR